MNRIPPAVTRGFVVVACGFTLAGAAAHLATYGPGDWVPTLTVIWPVLFIGVFPIYGFVVLVVGVSRIPLEALIGALPLAVKIAGGLLMAYVLVNFGLMFRALQGAHSQDPLYVARLFTGHTLFFYAASAAMGYEIDRARRGLVNLNRAPRDDALERRPLPSLLSRSLTLQTPLSPSECASRLMQPFRSRQLSLIGGYGLRGEASAEGFRMELGGARSSMVYAVGRFEGSGPTFIRLLLTFKRWHLIAIGAVLLSLPFVWLLLTPVGFSWQGLLFILVFAGGGNFVYALAQMRGLERQIRQATESQPVSIG